MNNYCVVTMDGTICGFEAESFGFNPHTACFEGAIGGALVSQFRQAGVSGWWVRDEAHS